MGNFNYTDAVHIPITLTKEQKLYCDEVLSACAHIYNFTLEKMVNKAKTPELVQPIGYYAGIYHEFLETFPHYKQRNYPSTPLRRAAYSVKKGIENFLNGLDHHPTYVMPNEFTMASFNVLYGVSGDFAAFENCKHWGVEKPGFHIPTLSQYIGVVRSIWLSKTTNPEAYYCTLMTARLQRGVMNPDEDV